MAYIKEYSELHPKEKRQLAYKRKYKDDVPSWDDSMVRLTRLVAERIQGRPSLLDLGCGHGNFVVDELGAVFGEKIGIDVSAETAKGNVSLDRLVFGDISSLSFGASSFDLVLSLWVLEHVADPVRVFAEVSRVLRPGGMFAFVTPNRRSLLIRLRRLISKKTADRLLAKLYGREDDDIFEIHYRANSVKDLREIVRKAGLEIEVLEENADPSYTSFDALSYFLSKVFVSIGGTLARPHLICVLRKV